MLGPSWETDLQGKRAHQGIPEALRQEVQQSRHLAPLPPVAPRTREIFPRASVQRRLDELYGAEVRRA